MGSDKNLVIVDDYYMEMGEFFRERGNEYDRILKRYIKILKSVKADGICSGKTAEALDAFIQLASRMEDNAGIIGESVRKMMESYISVVDSKDEYLF